MKKLQMIILAMLLAVAYNVMVRAEVSYYNSSEGIKVYEGDSVYTSVYYMNSAFSDEPGAYCEFMKNDQVLQLENEYAPTVSCVSSSAITITNIIGDEEIYSKHNMTYYSKLIGITETRGTYISNIKKIFDMDTNLVSNVKYLTGKKEIENAAVEIINKKGFIAVAVNTSKLGECTEKYSGSASYNHCVVIAGYITTQDNIYFIIVDPLSISGYTITSTELYNSLYDSIPYVTVYGKDSK
jgi:hypothetical protein